jgi:hypothetical protein
VPLPLIPGVMKKFRREPRNISRYFGGGVTEGEEEQD